MQERHRRAAPSGRRKKFSVSKDTWDFKRGHPLVAHLTSFMRSAYFGHYRQSGVPLERIWGHVQGCEECALRYDALIRDERARNQKPRR